MLKNLITPIQMWLLSQGRCVGCSADLHHAPTKEVNGKTIVTCRCGRIFVHEKSGAFRRALFEEI